MGAKYTLGMVEKWGTKYLKKKHSEYRELQVKAMKMATFVMVLSNPKIPSNLILPIITKKPILHLQVSTFIMKNMKFTRQKVIKKEGGTVKNE